MSQPRMMSAVEAVTNAVVGYALAVATQAVAFPVLGLQATPRQSLALGAIFTAVSLARSYVLRRLFDACSRTRTGRRRSDGLARALSRSGRRSRAMPTDMRLTWRRCSRRSVPQA